MCVTFLWTSGTKGLNSINCLKIFSFFLTHFWPMVPIYTKGFLEFSGGINGKIGQKRLKCFKMMLVLLGSFLQ